MKRLAAGFFLVIGVIVTLLATVRFVVITPDNAFQQVYAVLMAIVAVLGLVVAGIGALIAVTLSRVGREQAAEEPRGAENARAGEAKRLDQ